MGMTSSDKEQWPAILANNSIFHLMFLFLLVALPINASENNGTWKYVPYGGSGADLLLKYAENEEIMEIAKYYNLKEDEDLYDNFLNEAKALLKIQKTYAKNKKEMERVYMLFKGHFTFLNNFSITKIKRIIRKKEKKAGLKETELDEWILKEYMWGNVCFYIQETPPGIVQLLESLAEGNLQTKDGKILTGPINYFNYIPENKTLTTLFRESSLISSYQEQQQQFRTYLAPLMHLIRYFHYCGVLHNDIHGDNILLAKTEEETLLRKILIIDFGNSRSWDKEEETTINIKDTPIFDWICLGLMVWSFEEFFQTGKKINNLVFRWRKIRNNLEQNLLGSLMEAFPGPDNNPLREFLYRLLNLFFKEVNLDSSEEFESILLLEYLHV